MEPNAQSKTNRFPEELTHAFELSSRLKTRFELLPIEHQTAYANYISEAKTRELREERVEYSIPFIMKLRDPKELID